MIEAMAPFVARNGAAFEALAVRRNARDSRFGFLKGGPGAEYYRWRVQAGRPRQALAVEACTKLCSERTEPVAAHKRGAVLGAGVPHKPKHDARMPRWRGGKRRPRRPPSGSVGRG